jgi:hypothetical protein
MEDKMQKWEYQAVVTNRKRGWTKMTDWEPKIDLVKFGDYGWELISVVPVADDQGELSGMTHQLIYYFKRPKE